TAATPPPVGPPIAGALPPPPPRRARPAGAATARTRAAIGRRRACRARPRRPCRAVAGGARGARHARRATPSGGPRRAGRGLTADARVTAVARGPGAGGHGGQREHTCEELPRHALGIVHRG